MAANKSRYARATNTYTYTVTYRYTQRKRAQLVVKEINQDNIYFNNAKKHKIHEKQ